MPNYFTPGYFLGLCILTVALVLLWNWLPPTSGWVYFVSGYVSATIYTLLWRKFNGQ